MAMLPVRKLGSLGAIPDVASFELPPEAYTFAKNIRIEGGSTRRGGVFRTAASLAHDAMFLKGFFDANSVNQIIYGGTDGKLYSQNLGTDITTAGWTPSVSAAPVTSTIVNNMIYVNRGDHVPWVRSVDATGAFAQINTGAAQWDTTYRCKIIRGMNGIVVTFNITKGAVAYPTMVKWSGFTSFNAQPGDWDITSTTSSAGENTLSQMQGQIVDAALLRDRMMIYGSQETWAMDYIGGNDIFTFSRLFDFGIMNANCIIEHEGIHYVFGNDDIKKTDGISPVSIANDRVRRFIYDSMVKAQASYFFTAHAPRLNEVMFCYVANDGYTAFPSSAQAGCNRAAIYNYAEDVWYFADLPYVTCADQVKPIAGAIWTDETTTDWPHIGGSWADQAGDPKLNLVFAGLGTGTGAKMRTFDRINSTSTTYPLDTYANKGAYIERDNLSLDDIKASLRGYKLVSSVFPLAGLSINGAPLRFSIGVSDLPSVATVWGSDQTFDATQYKLDYNIAGRYLCYRMFQDDYQNFNLVGMDIDVTLLGEF